MKTKLSWLASAFFAATAATVVTAGPASAGPDFVGEAHGARPLAASDARTAILPEDDVAFDHDSHALRDTTMTQIATVARWLRAHPGHRLVLEGHADASGPALYNDDLAFRRADLVRQHLIGHGIASDRLLVVVYGESRAHREISPVDRRVVMFATREPLEAVARKVLAEHGANHALWTRNGVPFTWTHGTPGRDAGDRVATR